MAEHRGWLTFLHDALAECLLLPACARGAQAARPRAALFSELRGRISRRVQRRAGVWRRTVRVP